MASYSCSRNRRTVAPKYRLCPKCKYRYERIKKKCPSCAAPRPKKRVPKHAVTLRDHNYEHYLAVSKEIHGNGDESCDVCRKPRSSNKNNRRHDRDHDHVTGKPRGLACVTCNKLMVRDLTLERARRIVAYYERVEKHYTKPEGQLEKGPDES